MKLPYSVLGGLRARDVIEVVNLSDDEIDLMIQEKLQVLEGAYFIALAWREASSNKQKLIMKMIKENFAHLLDADETDVMDLLEQFKGRDLSKEQTQKIFEEEIYIS